MTSTPKPYEAITVLCAFPDTGEAERIARDLLEKRLIACAHIPAPGKSLYWWEDKIAEGSEIYALFKTTRGRYTAVEQTIRAQHSYQVPCIVTLPITDGFTAFLDWIAAETR